MAELEQPNIVGNYLSNYYTAQQRQQAEQDRQRTMQRQDRQDQMAETQGQYAQQEHALKMAQTVVGWLGAVPDGDANGFERVKQQWVQAGLPQEAVAAFTVADLPMLRQKAGTQLRDLELQYKRAQIEAQRASTAASYAAAARARAIPPGNIDPNTGARVAPAGVQGRDAGELKISREQADAAARAAGTLRSIAPSLDKIKTGPGTSGARTAAGIFSAIGDVISPVTEGLGFGQAFGSAKEFMKNYQAIEQASNDIGIAKLAEIGGSDTERELLTAIKTTVGADVEPEENMRRFSNQLAAADILAKKAELQTLWVNKAGSLNYSLPDGTTWPSFWSKFQKQAWADVRKQQVAKFRGGGEAPRGDYRQEQRDLMSGKAPGAVAPPPGFQIVR